MLRKTLLAFGAAAAIGAAALTPSTASAHGWWHGGWYGGWHHHYHGYGFGIGVYPAYYGYGGDCYVVRRFYRRVVVCD